MSRLYNIMRDIMALLRIKHSPITSTRTARTVSFFILSNVLILQHRYTALLGCKLLSSCKVVWKTIRDLHHLWILCEVSSDWLVNIILKLALLKSLAYLAE